MIEDPETYAEDEYATKTKESTFLKRKRLMAQVIDAQELEVPTGDRPNSIEFNSSSKNQRLGTNDFLY